MGRLAAGGLGLALTFLIASGGTAIAATVFYTCDRGGLCRIDTSGGKPKRLTRHSTDIAPTVSPNGRRLAFLRDGRLHVGDGRGRRVRRTEITDYSRFHPRHGRTLRTFGSNVSCDVDARTLRTIRCADLAQLPWWYGWGPPILQEVIVAEPEDSERLCVVDPQRRCVRVVIHERDIGAWAVSPDERWLAAGIWYWAGDESNSEYRLHVYDVRTGAHVRQLTSGHVDAHIAWTPDSRRLVFHRDAIAGVPRDHGTIWTVARSGGPARRLAAGLYPTASR